MADSETLATRDSSIKWYNSSIGYPKLVGLLPLKGGGAISVADSLIFAFSLAILVVLIFHLTIKKQLILEVRHRMGYLFFKLTRMRGT